jgi:DNA-binding transcriptional LysR family regulator
VALFIEATDHAVNMQEDRFDVSLQVNVPASENMDFVALHLGSARRLLVAQPALLDRLSRPERPSGLAGMPCMCRITDMKDGRANWILSHEISAETQTIDLAVKLMTSDMRVQLEAALQGIGVALLPEPLVSDALKDKQLERVLPQWSAGHNDIQLVYRSPRGMLPSVRSLIDYLIAHFPDEIRRRGVQDPSP